MDDRDRRLLEAAARIGGGETIFDALDEYLDGLDTATRRARIDGMWLQLPVDHAEALAAYPELRDQFDILQGDIVRTDAAYLLGERAAGATYVVASATCDSVVRPKPRQGTILLLPVVPFAEGDFAGKTADARERSMAELLERLLSFDTSRALYLPGLPGDPAEVLVNTISFKDVCTMASDLVPTVERVASMTLVGWRAFSLLVRSLITRTGDEELGFRAAVDEARAA